MTDTYNDEMFDTLRDQEDEKKTVMEVFGEIQKSVNKLDELLKETFPNSKGVQNG